MIVLWLALHAVALDGFPDEDGLFAPCAVAVEVSDGDSMRTCTATVVHERWLLTAASCIGPGDPELTVLVGPRPDDPEAVVAVARAVLHPEFDAATLDNDIAAIELDQPVTPDPVALDFGRFLDLWPIRPTFAGYGRSDDGPRERVVVGLSVRPSWEGPWEVELGDGQACRGDGGAPALYSSTPSIIAGILSEPAADCVTGLARVEPIELHLGWLTELGVPWVPAYDGDPGVLCRGLSGGGHPPFEVECRVYAPDPAVIGPVTWDWDDGSSPTTESVHTYEEAGAYRAQGCFQVDGVEECHGQYFLVCDETLPVPTVAPVEGLTAFIVDASDTQPYDCIDTLTLNIYPPGGATPLDTLIDRPFRYTFPAAGDYDLELVVTRRIDAIVRTTVTIEDVGPVKSGCATAPASGGAWVVLVGLVGLLRRRRG